MSATRTITGARWSSAVRCATKAQHEALGTPREDNPPPWLEGAFARGFHVGEAWAMIQAKRLEADAKTVECEMEVPWGPPEFGWRGHVDLANLTDKVVFEAYHSKELEFRDVKAMQAAGYATSLGPDWRAVVVAIDATDVTRDDGFAVRPYPVNVAGLRARVLETQARVVTAVALGEWNPDDRVSDTPKHAECQACPFSSVCHAGWTPPAPQDVVGLETSFDALRIVQSDLSHAEAKVADLKRMRDEYREDVREYLPLGVPVESGGVVIRRSEVAGRVSVKLADFTKAGFTIPSELEPFVSQGQPSERWKVDTV